MGQSESRSIDEDDSLMSEEPRHGRTFTKGRNIIIATVIGVAVVGVIIAVVVWKVTEKPHGEEIPTEPYERARYLQSKHPLIDGHNDLPWQYRKKVEDDVSKLDISVPQPQLHTDIPRLREGLLGGQFWSVYVPCENLTDPVKATMEQIDVVYRLAERYPETFQLAYTADDVSNAFSEKKIASLMGMEGGHSIQNSTGALRMFFLMGARYMTLTHTCSTPWAQSSADTNGTVIGLTSWGKEIVLEMNRLGMLVDISHVAPQTMHDTLDTVRAPVIFSHSNTLALCNNSRNVPDDVLARLPANGGVVMVVFYPVFVCDNVTDCTLNNVVDHIDHIRKIAGIDHIGIGSDFDGVTSLVKGLEDVSKYPHLTAELVRRGYSDNDIAKILGQNVMRVLARAEEVAEEMNGD